MKRVFGLFMSAVVVLSIIVGCATPTAEVIEKEVTKVVTEKETVVVKEEVEVEVTKVVKEEVEVTKVVEKEVTKVVEKVVEVTPTPVPLTYKEAPMLADLVSKGDLPPVEQRVPTDPRVVEGPTGIGVYGGTLYMLDAMASLSIPHRFTDHGLLGYNIPTSAYHADVLKDWSWNEDYTELTFYLRKGMKWSDGEDVTTEDFEWYYDNVMWHEELRPTGPGYPWEINDVRAKLDVIDDYTLTYTFAEPVPAILDRWGRSSMSSPGQWFWGPSHWQQKFHVDFRDRKELNAEAEAAGYAATDTAEPWRGYFFSKGGQFYRGVGWGDNLDMPTLRPYNPIEVTQEYILMERNPYFWYVDSEGNQLPYFDYYRVDMVADLQLYNLKLTAGEADVAMWFPQFDAMELYKANELAGGYQTLVASYPNECAGGFSFNQAYQEDMVIGDLLRNIDFRRAVSMGYDRDDMNDTLYLGLAEKHPTAPLKSMPWWSDTFWNEYYEYDLVKANQMLDDLGLDKRDGEGYRLMSDGRRLTLLLTGDYAYYNIQAEMIIGDMKDLGIEIIYKLLEPSAFSAATLNNEMQLVGRLGPSRMTLFGRGLPDQWALETGGNNWGRPFVQWIQTDGEEGVEPPAYIKEHTDKWADFAGVPSDSPEAAAIGKEYFQFFADQLFFLCGAGIPPQPFVIGNDIGNFPREELVFVSDNNFYHPYTPELWYRR